MSTDGESVELRVPEQSSSVAMDTSAAIQRFPDCFFVRADANDILAKLRIARDCSTALDFTLMTLDADLSEGCRQLAANELACLLENGECHDYVLDVILATPLSPGVDVNGALACLQGHGTVVSLLRQIGDAQECVTRVCKAWFALLEHDMVKAGDPATVRGALIRGGVFRRLTLEAPTQADVDRVLPEIVLKGVQGCDARIVQALIQSYREQLPPGERQVRQLDNRPHDGLGGESPEDVYTSSTDTPKQGRADELATWASGQVNAIVERFRNGRDNTAFRFLDELVTAQTTGTRDYKHVVKSLCNIAKQVSLLGRHELSLECLRRAFEFRSGVDSVVFVQLGDEFYGQQQLDRAEDCYREAQNLERHVQQREDVTRKLIRVLSARGKFVEALGEYGKVTDLNNSPEYLTDKATVLRKLARFDESRQCYLRALAFEPSRHQARAGLAEILKQNAKLHRSIAAYNAILRGADVLGAFELDDGSRKIYRLAQSFLLRLTYQFERAEKLLTDLHREYPFDSHVGFQLGKLLILMGRNEEGGEIIDSGDTSCRLRTLGEELFRLAVGTESPTASRYGTVAGIALRPIDDYHPDDRGLAACRSAFQAIQRDAFDEALSFTESAFHVNKLHRDFGFVLGFHARKRSWPGYDFKSKQPLARIAKRGYRELRDSVHLIAEGRFGEATENERRMFLLVA